MSTARYGDTAMMMMMIDDDEVFDRMDADGSGLVTFEDGAVQFAHDVQWGDLRSGRLI